MNFLSALTEVPRRAKLVIVGTLTGPDQNLLKTRSLNTEHVSSADLIKREISRPSSLATALTRSMRVGDLVADEHVLAVLRRWLWSRKPDAGFLLEGFPATLLQAVVFDEWLESRNQTLFGVVLGRDRPTAVYNHYRLQGVPLWHGAHVS